MTAKVGKARGRDWSKKEKGLMDMDNSVVTAVREERYKGTKW